MSLQSSWKVGVVNQSPIGPETIELAVGGMRCILRPSLGGCVAGLWLEGEPVLRSLPLVRSVREAANFPLVPFSNRIAWGRLQWHGQTHQLAQNFAPEPHAMHGVGWQRAWTTVHCDRRSAGMLLEHDASDAWPFAFDCRQDFRLEEHALHVSLSLSNTGKVAAPAGLGWHPYIVKRPGSRVRFQASGFWETDAQGLPLRRVPSLGLDAGCDGLDVNHAFEGWNGPAVVTDDKLEVSITSDLARLIVSTNPSKGFIAIEPVSHVPDSFNRPDDTRGTAMLQPAQTLHAQMQIRVRRTD